MIPKSGACNQVPLFILAQVAWARSAEYQMRAYACYICCTWPEQGRSTRPGESPVREKMNSNRRSERERLAVLRLAEELGNVSAACRRYGISRVRYYAWKRNYELYGEDGLKARPPIAAGSSRRIPQALQEMIQVLSLEYPASSFRDMQRILSVQGQHVSWVTIRRHLQAACLARKYDRWLALEQLWAENPQILTDEQITFIEEWNPQFAERHTRYDRPGELVCLHAFPAREKPAGSWRGIYLHATIDMCTAYAWGRLWKSKSLEGSVKLLEEGVCPYYDRLGIEIKALLAGRGISYMNQSPPPAGVHAGMNGFMERFRRSVREEFFNKEETGDKKLHVLQERLDQWLAYYNRKRRHEGYPNMGLTPEAAMVRHGQQELLS